MAVSVGGKCERVGAGNASVGVWVVWRNESVGVNASRSVDGRWKWDDAGTEWLN